MSVFTFEDDGEVTLDPAATALLLVATVIGGEVSFGNANPTNYYGMGLLRFGIGGYYLPAFPVDAQQQYIAVPTGATTLAYSMLNASEATVTELGVPVTGNILLASGTGVIPTVFFHYQTPPIDLPNGYDSVTMRVENQTFVDGYAKLLPDTHPDQNLTGDQHIPCLTTVPGPISPPRVVLDFYGSQTGQADWWIYAHVP